MHQPFTQLRSRDGGLRDDARTYTHAQVTYKHKERSMRRDINKAKAYYLATYLKSSKTINSNYLTFLCLKKENL